MNRRLIVALAVVLPLALFGAAKWATRWRPVAIGRVDSMSSYGEQARIQATQNTVVVTAEKTHVFDLKTGRRTDDLRWSICIDGLATWQYRKGAKTQILIQRDGVTRVYDLPKGEMSEDLFNYLPLVQVRDATDRVELLYENRYFRWKPDSPSIQRAFRFDLDLVTGGNNAFPTLTRDGQFIVKVADKSDEIARVSTSDGRVVGSVKAKTSSLWAANLFSPFGSYAIYTVGNYVDRASLHWQIVDTTTGRLLWSFPQVSDTWIEFSPDETQVAIPFVHRKQWEIRDLKTGQLLRTLPLLPSVTDGQFSPDNSTLYSVANGVLYRQRAR